MRAFFITFLVTFLSAFQNIAIAQVPQTPAPQNSPSSPDNTAQPAIEEATINVSDSVGPAVVSVGTEVLPKKSKTKTFYYGPRGQGQPAPFGGGNDDALRRFFEEFFGQMPEEKQIGLGSGVIIDEKGFILTNGHVVNDADKINITLSDGRKFKGEVRGKDARSDLAIVKINADHLPVAKLGDSGKLRIGQWVVAIGNPFGFALRNHEPTLTVGVISALHRVLGVAPSNEGDYSDLVQTDAAINPGNSGGPLVNLHGEVIGINVAIYSTSGGYEGVGFAIPINVAKKIMTRLIEGKKIQYGWFGVSIQDLNEELAKQFGVDTKGALVAGVLQNSPAEKAGIKSGDVIRRVNNQEVTNARALTALVENIPVGSKVPVTVIRQGKETNLQIEIGERPEKIEKGGGGEGEESGTWRGLRIRELTPEIAQKLGVEQQKGVVVVDVDAGSPADDAGLSPGDVILEINRQTVNNSDDYRRITNDLKGDALIQTTKGFFVMKG
jgi:serine protease Do